MSDKTQEDYDLEKVYDEKIYPLMAEVLKICKENNLPMFASFAYRHSQEDENETSFCTSTLLFPKRTPMELVEAKSALTEKPSGLFAFTITSEATAKKS